MRRGGRAIQKGAHVLRSSTRQNTTLAPSRPLPHSLLPPKHHSEQSWYLSPREGMGRGAWREPAVCLSAPFTEPRPPPRRERSALPLHLCLITTQCHAFTKIQLYQTSPKYLCQVAKRPSGSDRASVQINFSKQITKHTLVHKYTHKHPLHACRLGRPNAGWRQRPVQRFPAR